jgi:hypothetical protein
VRIELIVAAGIFAGLIVILSVWLDLVARRAIAERVRALGGAPTGIRRRWIRRLFVRGFSGLGVAYWVTEGEDGRTRLYGYDPAGWLARSHSGVKRFSGGVWRDEHAPARAVGTAKSNRRRRSA